MALPIRSATRPRACQRVTSSDVSGTRERDGSPGFRADLAGLLRHVCAGLARRSRGSRPRILGAGVRCRHALVSAAVAGSSRRSRRGIRDRRHFRPGRHVPSLRLRSLCGLADPPAPYRARRVAHLACAGGVPAGRVAAHLVGSPDPLAADRRPSRFGGDVLPGMAAQTWRLRACARRPLRDLGRHQAARSRRPGRQPRHRPVRHGIGACSEAEHGGALHVPRPAAHGATAAHRGH